MKRELAVFTVGIAVLAGCGPSGGTPGGDPTSATSTSPSSVGGPTAGRNAQIKSALDLGGSGTQDRVRVASANGGELELDDADGTTLRFPRFEDTTDAPSAVVGVWPEGDALTPGDDAFSFGADFRLDAHSSGSASDNGDNLLQRGFFTDRAQYKIQVDEEVASCRVQGSEGTVLVKADKKIEPEQWYSVECARKGDSVTLTLTGPGEDAEPQTYTASGEVGTVTPKDPNEPLSIGGKLSADGKITTSATDQFNGWVRNVFVHVDNE